jgi:predicted nucleic acid-binding protein
MILLDTNILTVSKQAGHRDYNRVTTMLTRFIADKEELVICPQNIYEFFVVATRPTDSRGLGLTRQKTLEEMDNLKLTYNFMNDPETLFTNWENIVRSYEVSGKQGHDARLVAFMIGHGITRIYTMNNTDFNRYADIITILN